MQKRTKIVAALLAAGILAVTAVALLAFIQPSAEDILTEALTITESITDGHAIVEFSGSMPDKDVSGTAEVWGKLNVGPNGEPALRVEVLSASQSDMGGTVFVADGVQFWLWNPVKNTVLVGTFAELKEKMAERAADYDGAYDFDHEGQAADADHPETAEEAVAKLTEYFTVEKMGTEDVAGTPTNKLRLIPIAEKMPEQMRAAGGLFYAWFRASDNAPLAIEYTGSALGGGQATAVQLDLNQGVADGRFNFIIPAGAEVVNIADLEPPQAETLGEADAAALGLLVPASLPEGASLLETVDMMGTAVQRYSLPDGQSFTIAQGAPNDRFAPDGASQTVTVRGVSATLYSDEANSRTLLTWTEGETQFWIGGDLTPEQAAALAESLN
jgi:outer membrane lipoprotein-sorting protein